MRAARETGKPPLLPVLLWVLTPVFGSPLIAGRTVSAIAGTATVALCFLLGARLRDRALGLQAAVLYAVSPWAVLHERLAIHDGLLTLAMGGTLLLTWAAAQQETWRSAFLAALVAALSVQVKQSAVLVAALPFLALVFTRSFTRSALARASVIAGAAMLSFLALIMGPFHGMNGGQPERLSPFVNLSGNLRGLGETTGIYLPLGLGAIVIGGVLLAFLERARFAAYLSLAFLTWALPWPFSGPFAPSRYYLPAGPLACVLAPFTFHWIAERFARASTGWRLAGRFYVAAVALVMATRSAGMAADLATARLPELDAFQYQRDWPAGFGLQEACAYVFERAESGAQVVPAMHPRHQLVCGSVNPPRTDVTVLPFPDFRTEIRLGPYSRSSPLYLVVDDSPGGALSGRIRDADPTIVVERTFPRPGGRSTIFVLRRSADEPR